MTNTVPIDITVNENGKPLIFTIHAWWKSDHEDTNWLHSAYFSEVLAETTCEHLNTIENSDNWGDYRKFAVHTQEVIE